MNGVTGLEIAPGERGVSIEREIENRGHADRIKYPGRDAFHQIAMDVKPLRLQNLIGTKWFAAIRMTSSAIPKPRLQPISFFSIGSNGSTGASISFLRSDMLFPVS